MNRDDLLVGMRLAHRVVRQRYLAFVNANNTRLAYRFHIFQTMQYVRHTAPVLRIARASCPHDLLPWLEQHIREEAGHELLFESDLEQTGGLPDWPVSPFVLEFVDSAYISARMVHGFSRICADMLIAECDPPTTSGVRAWAKTLGLPLGSTSGLSVHADADGKHSKEILEVLNHPEVRLELLYARLMTISLTFSNHMEWMSNYFSRTFQDATL